MVYKYRDFSVQMNFMYYHDANRTRRTRRSDLRIAPS